MRISILGIRGIPASHGGFETFAEKLAIYLSNMNWKVTVYCQDNKTRVLKKEYWRGIKLIKIPSKYNGSIGSIIFDYKSVMLAKKSSEIFLTLGYKTAIFSILLNKKINITNMDGLEWKRRKYNLFEKIWLRLNEKFAVVFSAHIIADNPAIKKRMEMISPSKKLITMIPYGAERPKNNLSNDEQKKTLNALGIHSPEYILIVARPVEENNIFEIVQTFSKKKRKHKLVILGDYKDSIRYQKKVLNIAGKEVLFLGAIYNKIILDILRTHAKLYIHGHSVGGTNPALVEAMGAGIAVLAYDNSFNRWVAGNNAHYFSNGEELNQKLDNLLSNKEEIEKMSISSLNRYKENFKWEKILVEYERVFKSYLPKY